MRPSQLAKYRKISESKFRMRRQTAEIKAAIKFARSMGGRFRGTPEQRETFRFWYSEYWVPWL